MTDFLADCVTDFCIFLSFKLVGKSFGGTYALGYHDALSHNQMTAIAMDVVEMMSQASNR